MSELHDHDHSNDNEVLDMPSTNHSYIQIRIGGLFLDHDKFTPFSALTLDANQIDLSKFCFLYRKDDLIPDVCLYESVHQFDPMHDVLKRSDMPVLAIEILSPNQGTHEIMNKFDAYFALGIKSCWLVILANESVTVYSSQGNFNFKIKFNSV
jgi:Uma2 family endonuclease